MGRKPRITPPFGLQVGNFERPLASEGADPRLVPHAGAKNPAIRRFQAQYRPMANGNVIDIANTSGEITLRLPSGESSGPINLLDVESVTPNFR